MVKEIILEAGVVGAIFFFSIDGTYKSREFILEKSSN